MAVPSPRRPPHDPDPFGLVDAFLRVATSGGADAERVYLAWLVSLDPALDPALAATRVLAEREQADRVPPTDPAHRRLLALLAATARWPRTAVAAYIAGRASPLELS
jgi:hypothetical protein